MLEIQITGTEAIAANLQSMPDRVNTALQGALQSLADQLVSYVQENKLSGQVLNRRSGALASSIVGTVDGVTCSIGSDMPYAAFWEYGFTGTESVRSYIRKRQKGGEVAVRAFTRMIDQAPRSYLQSALDENGDLINSTVNDAIKQASAL